MVWRWQNHPWALSFFVQLHDYNMANIYILDNELLFYHCLVCWDCPPSQKDSISHTLGATYFYIYLTSMTVSKDVIKDISVWAWGLQVFNGKPVYKHHLGPDWNINYSIRLIAMTFCH